MEQPATRVTFAAADGGPDQSIDDASDEVLPELLNDVAAGTLLFFILTRRDDPNEQTFIQVASAEGGALVIEHRQGSAESHFVATSADLPLLHEVLISWRLGSARWESALSWRPLQEDASSTTPKPKRKWFGR